MRFIEVIMRSAWQMQDDICHQIKFLKGKSLKAVWDTVQDQVRLLPRLSWKKRGRKYKGTPVDFVRENYGEWHRGTWHRANVTIEVLKRDQPLYKRYKTWIARHPADDLHLPESNSAPAIQP